MVGLKAVLAQEQQASASGQRASVGAGRKFEKKTAWKAPNTGVTARAQRDLEQHRREAKSLENVEAKLREKSALYEKFVLGGATSLYVASPRASTFVITPTHYFLKQMSTFCACVGTTWTDGSVKT